MYRLDTGCKLNVDINSWNNKVKRLQYGIRVNLTLFRLNSYHNLKSQYLFDFMTCAALNTSGSFPLVSMVIVLLPNPPMSNLTKRETHPILFILEMLSSLPSCPDICFYPSGRVPLCSLKGARPDLIHSHSNAFPKSHNHDLLCAHQSKYQLTRLIGFRQ